MKNKIIFFIIMLCAFAFAENVDSVNVDVPDVLEVLEEETETTEEETETAEKTEPPADDLDDYEADFIGFAYIDTTEQIVVREIVRREYAHRRQMRLAIVMMVFVIAAFTSAQSWNPR